MIILIIDRHREQTPLQQKIRSRYQKIGSFLGRELWSNSRAETTIESIDMRGNQTEFGTLEMSSTSGTIWSQCAKSIALTVSEPRI